ncbi:nudC domain-containing protein 3 [Leguminivora glycinivorella]|uniref:nudC domain-containing protein 3 n=1 Tax=Leguminivora glycinivorella TaxID=1035111 RepID=UPI00200FAED3|nr:nudC domain-containing protein 3 [Leguminivora glycinivorella]
MSVDFNSTKYDDVLSSILVNEQSILGFLSAIFNFLARRTDFYHVPDGPYENMGFPPGVAEELVIKVLRTCDPKNWKGTNGARKPDNFNNEIMCSTVAQEVEVVAENGDENEPIENYPSGSEVAQTTEPEKIVEASSSGDTKTEYTPPVIPVQKNSESYNGAVRDKYSWSQTITEIDVTVPLPPDIKSSKDLKVTINPNDLHVAYRNSGTIIKDMLQYKIKASDSVWTISGGKLLIHLEKVQERWWTKLVNSEEEIDLDKIDCSRPLNELPEDHIAKVRELQWNQEQKLKGLPTSNEIKNIEILKRAWNAEGSPFKGKEFDPSVLQPH